MSNLFGGGPKKKGAKALSLTESIFGTSSSSSSKKTKASGSGGGGGEDTLFAIKQPHIGSNKRLRISQKQKPATRGKIEGGKKKKSLSREETIRQRRQQSQSEILDQLTISLKDYHQSGDSGGSSGNGNTNISNVSLEELCADVRGLMKHHGLVILRNALSNKQVTKISNLANEAQTTVCNELDSKNIPYDSDVNDIEPVCFQELAVRCRGRMDVRYKDNYKVSGNTVAKDGKQNKKKQNKEKSRLPSLSLIDNLAASILHGAEEPNLVYAGWIFSFPGSADQPWHQDGSPLFEKGTESLPSYALNVFCGLHNDEEEDEELLLELGPTEFVVGSHHMEPESAIDRVDTAVSAVLGRCDILLYDYRICHRGTSNISAGSSASAAAAEKVAVKKGDGDGTSGGVIRKVLYLMYARPWFREHLNFGEDSLFGKSCNR